LIHFRKNYIVFQMHMLVEVLLEGFQPLIGDGVGIASVARQ
jgi:hypothetical protein